MRGLGLVLPVLLLLVIGLRLECILIDCFAQPRSGLLESCDSQHHVGGC